MNADRNDTRNATPDATEYVTRTENESVTANANNMASSGKRSSDRGWYIIYIY